MGRDQAIHKAVSMLLNGYPASERALGADAIALYLTVASRQPAPVVRRVVEKFLFGKIDRKNRDFAPSVESFAAALSAEAKSETEIAEWCQLNGYPVRGRRQIGAQQDRRLPDNPEMGQRVRALLTTRDGTS